MCSGKVLQIVLFFKTFPQFLYSLIYSYGPAGLTVDSPSPPPPTHTPPIIQTIMDPPFIDLQLGLLNTVLIACYIAIISVYR